MVLVHAGEYLLIDFLHHYVVLTHDPVACDCLNDAAAEKLRESKCGRLVVDDRPFNPASLDRRELAPHGTVADGDLGGSEAHDASGPDDLHTDGHHD